MTPDELRRYAEMIVRGCIAFRRGDELLIRPSLAHRELAVAVAEAAYRAGARAVDVEYDDNRLYAARIREGSEQALGGRTSWQKERMRALGREEVAIVQVMGEYENDVLADLPPERVAEATKRLTDGTLGRIRREARLRGTICAWPTEDWAARVFPGVPAARAMRTLAATCSGSAASAPTTRRVTRVDRAPDDPAPACGAADEARPEGAARARPRHRPTPADRRARCGAAAASRTRGAAGSR
jgi:Leucyl aminopeptidase (aminopeptidase T)